MALAFPVVTAANKGDDKLLAQLLEALPKENVNTKKVRDFSNSTSRHRKSARPGSHETGPQRIHIIPLTPRHPSVNAIRGGPRR